MTMTYFLVILYFLLSGLSICTTNIPNFIPVGFNVIFAGIGASWLILNKKIKIDEYYKLIILGIFFPQILSLINSLINSFFVGETYINFFLKISKGRKINLILFFIIFSFLNSYICKLEKEKLKKILKYYILGISIFFVLFGFWQFFNKYFGIPMINLNSRSHIHSVSNVASFIKLRVTGLANEPSYISPFLIDSIVLCWVLRYKKLGILSFACLLLTYSGGGYINIFFIFLLYFFYPNIMQRKNRIKILTVGIIIFLILLTLKFDIFIKIFSPVLNRFNSQNNLLDMSYNIRTYMILMPFKWILEEKNPLSIFLGMGPGSYKYLSLTKSFKNGISVHITSNNLFSDFIYENGYFGFFSLCLIFLIILKFLNKNLRKEKNYYNKGNILLLFHLIISSLYRADFMSSRFWIILIIIKINMILGDNSNESIVYNNKFFKK